MKHLTTYDPQEFLPIYIEGKLANGSEFIRYKAAKVAGSIVNALDSAYYTLGGRNGL